MCSVCIPIADNMQVLHVCLWLPWVNSNATKTERKRTNHKFNFLIDPSALSDFAYLHSQHCIHLQANHGRMESRSRREDAHKKKTEKMRRRQRRLSLRIWNLICMHMDRAVNRKKSPNVLYYIYITFYRSAMRNHGGCMDYGYAEQTIWINICFSWINCIGSANLIWSNPFSCVVSYAVQLCTNKQNIDLSAAEVATAARTPTNNIIIESRVALALTTAGFSQEILLQIEFTAAFVAFVHYRCQRFAARIAKLAGYQFFRITDTFIYITIAYGMRWARCGWRFIVHKWPTFFGGTK